MIKKHLSLLFIGLLSFAITGCGLGKCERTNPEMLDGKGSTQKTISSENDENLPDETVADLDESTAEEQDASQEFDIRGPIEFARYTFDDGYLSERTLIFECINGTYDRTQAPWMRTWSGMFQFRMIEGEPDLFIEEPGNSVVSCQIQQAFTEPFELYAKDYNGDGLMEFALAQFESSSDGDTCRMFTIKEDGKVEEIPVKNDKRYISDGRNQRGICSEADDSGRYLFVGRRLLCSFGTKNHV